LKYSNPVKRKYYELLLFIFLFLVIYRGGKSGKSCQPRSKKIFLKSRFGRKYFVNMGKAQDTPSIFHQ